MSQGANGGCLGALSMIVMIGLPLWVGYETWQWLSPDSFIDILLFLLVWGLLSSIVDAIAMGILALLAKIFE